MYNSTDPQIGYNVSMGGRGQLGLVGEKSASFGKTLSFETRKKLSEANKGNTHTEETKKKISEAMKGKRTGDKNPLYGIVGEKHHNYNHNIDNQEIYKLHDQGLSQRKIASILGCGQQMICRRLKKQNKEI